MSKNLLSSISRSKVAANRAANAVSPQELQKAISNLQAAQKRIKEKASQKAAQAHANKIAKLKRVMEGLGLSDEDLRTLLNRGRTIKGSGKKPANSKVRSTKGRKVPAKYQLKIGNVTHKWTGRGRMPLVFKEHVANGGSMEKCLIK